MRIGSLSIKISRKLSLRRLRELDDDCFLITIVANVDWYRSVVYFFCLLSKRECFLFALQKYVEDVTFGLLYYYNAVTEVY